ncbi:MAG: transcription antitermination factor NusB [Elusimicrobia bacterium]|nr:transcription antitermination factor NusB [Elusimicrobiota bacterium]
MNANSFANKRRLAREYVLQSLYLAEVGGLAAEQIFSIIGASEISKVPESFEFYKNLFSLALANLEQIDGVIKSVSQNWDIKRMAAVDKAILRLAVCEMTVLKDTPAAVIIDEAIEIAKKYSTEKSGRFVNGIMDNIAKKGYRVEGVG